MLLSKEINLALKTTEDPLVYQNPLPTTSKINPMRSNSPLSVGFINKGNIFYTDTILQALSVLPLLRNRSPSDISSLSPIQSQLL